MFDRLKESELYKSLSEKFKVKFGENKKVAVGKRDIKKKEVKDQLCLSGCHTHCAENSTCEPTLHQNQYDGHLLSSEAVAASRFLPENGHVFLVCVTTR